MATAFNLRPLRRINLTWLLWLALLLPLAQLAATWHGLNHALSDSALRYDDAKAAHAATHCDLCLVAAVVGGAAAPGAVPDLVCAAGTHVHGHTPPGSVWQPPVQTGYASRAPPRLSA